jgi:CheY-like chemotaxis protein
VADDDPLVRDLWCEALTRAGYRTLPAKTGHEAIELMRTIVPDLAILDLRMPGLTGGDVLKYLHDSAALRRIPVLIVSGFLADEPAEAATGLNLVGRLPKPLASRGCKRRCRLHSNALDHPLLCLFRASECLAHRPEELGGGERVGYSATTPAGFTESSATKQAPLPIRTAEPSTQSGEAGPRGTPRPAGGFWSSNLLYLRVANRNDSAPDDRGDNIRIHCAGASLSPWVLGSDF